MKIILKNSTVIDPRLNLNRAADITITDGIIESLEPVSEIPEGAEVYDFTGCITAPGFFDMHVHLREPGREGSETIETGCNAAAMGGFTGVASMPNTTPAADSFEVVSSIIQKSRNHVVDVFPVGAATLERKGEYISPIAEMKDAGAVAVSDDGVAIKSAKIFRSIMEYASMYDIPVIEHCEDESLAGGAMNEGYHSTLFGLPGIPALAEDLIVMRDILITEYVGGRLHIAHISTAKAVEMVRAAKAKGIKVTAEVTPHHFTLTEEYLRTYDTNYKMNPPLRTKKDVEAMLEGLRDGTIDCIASDHAPHPEEEKDKEFEYAPNGIIGLETQLGLALTHLYHTKLLSIETLIEKLSINPRKILNIPVPEIKAGNPANLTIFNPDYEWVTDKRTFKSKSKNSPFDGLALKGKSVAVFNKGKIFVC